MARQWSMSRWLRLGWLRQGDAAVEHQAGTGHGFQDKVPHASWAASLGPTTGLFPRSLIRGIPPQLPQMGPAPPEPTSRSILELAHQRMQRPGPSNSQQSLPRPCTPQSAHGAHTTQAALAPTTLPGRSLRWQLPVPLQRCTARHGVCGPQGSCSCGVGTGSAGAWQQGGPHQQQQRAFFSLPNPSELWREFQDPRQQVTSAIITLNIIMYLASLMNPRLFQLLVGSSYHVAQGEWWRLATAGLLHGGVLHLLANQLALHCQGPAMEEVAGRYALAVIYVSGVVGGGLCHYYYGAASTLIVGSSGGVLGVFAAYLVYKVRNSWCLGFSSEEKQWVAQVLLMNAALAFLLSGSVAHMGHLGGLLGGATACWLVGPRWVRGEYGRPVNRPLIPLPH
ncbi:hypothetical protein V8C86DRAFT_2767663 [Haematococcus lacustris]